MQVLVIPVIFFLSLLLSFKLRFFHVLHFFSVIKGMLVSAFPRKNKKRAFSSFYAFAIVLGGNLGVGSVAGTAMAVSVAGPGAILWMCLIAVIASSIKYASCVLGIKYRKKKASGTFVGGPMYYISDVLGYKFLSLIFAFSIILGAVTIGNFIQVNSLAIPLQYLNVPPLIVGVFIALIVLLVILGSLKFFTKFISSVVPIMAIAYIFSCLVILFIHGDKFIPAIMLIFSSSFSISAVSGAAVGYSFLEIIKIIQTALSRAIIATDIGMGLESIIHSEVNQESSDSRLSLAIEQGLISTVSPFIVMLISFMTTVVFIVTDVWNSGMKSSQMCFEAFRIGFSSDIAGYLLTAMLFCFAFTTMLTWLFCADKAIDFLSNDKYFKNLWHGFFVAVVPIGSIMSIDIIWGIADVTVTIILLINVFALYRLNESVIAETRPFFHFNK